MMTLPDTYLTGIAILSISSKVETLDAVFMYVLNKTDIVCAVSFEIMLLVPPNVLLKGEIALTSWLTGSKNDYFNGLIKVLMTVPLWVRP